LTAAGLLMTLANGVMRVVADGPRITFATGAFVAAGWRITIADAGPFIPHVEAVPLGHCQAASEFSAARDLTLAAVGLDTTFAVDLPTVAAGWPINVADAGAFNPIFEAVPLGKRAGGVCFCTVVSLRFAV
jgi:hypothetical protein